MPLTYHCESSDIERLLRRMEDIATRDGSTFSNRTIICEAGGNMWVETKDKSATDEPMMWQSHDCMSPVYEAELALQGGDMVILNMPGHWTETRRKIFECMVELYNLSGKMASTLTSFPSLALHDHPRILERISGARSPRLLERHRTLVQNKGLEGAAIDTFLHSRTLGYKAKGTEKNVQSLIAFIELYNHHIFGKSYDSDEGGVRMGQSCPIPDGNECFAIYGMYDAMSMFMNYGYPDCSGKTVAAVPMTIDLPGLGTITNLATNAKNNNKLTDQLSDLRPFLPVISVDGTEATISKMIFPGTNSPRALARVLGVVIGQLAKRLEMQPNRDLIRLAETQVLNNTMGFYLSLRDYLDNPANVAGADEPTIAGAKTVVAHLLDNLRAYRIAS